MCFVQRFDAVIGWHEGKKKTVPLIPEEVEEENWGGWDRPTHVHLENRRRMYKYGGPGAGPYPLVLSV